jgi:hypothetical protein
MKSIGNGPSYRFCFMKRAIYGHNCFLEKAIIVVPTILHPTLALSHISSYLLIPLKRKAELSGLKTVLAAAITGYFSTPPLCKTRSKSI